MSVDGSLFGDDEPLEVGGRGCVPSAVPSDEESTEVATPLPDWQVELLRKALEARSLTSMQQRQRVVSEYAGRQVTSLRELSRLEARVVAERLARERSVAAGTHGSSWDDREEDTWIDRL